MMHRGEHDEFKRRLRTLPMASLSFLKLFRVSFKGSIIVGSSVSKTVQRTSVL